METNPFSMKQTKSLIRGVIALIVLLVSLEANTAYGLEPIIVKRQASDFLAPVDMQLEKPFRAFLQCKLYVSRSEYGRMTVQPSGAPEYSVCISSEGGSSSPEVIEVSSTRASANLWNAVEKQTTNPFLISVTRHDAVIAKPIAVGIRRIWRTMLGHVREYVRPTDTTLPTDGETVEFSLLTSENEELSGESPIDAGKNALAMREIGELLIKYSECEPADRNPVAKDIELQSNRLLNELDRQGLAFN